jgi:hypothetical protein
MKALLLQDEWLNLSSYSFILPPSAFILAFPVAQVMLTLRA